MAYLAGNIAKFNVTFETTATGALIDPTTVKFQWQLNAGAITPYTWNGANTTPGVTLIAKNSTGVYEMWVDTTGMNGVLTGTWISTGSGAATVVDTVSVGNTNGVGATFGSLIEEVYARAMGSRRERTVLLNNGATLSSIATTTVLSGSQTSGIRVGVIIAVEMEKMYVTAWNSGTLTATLIRGYGGSTPAFHLDQTLVYLNPTFARYDIGVALNEDLNSLSARGLYRVGVATLTYNPVFRGYDLGGAPQNFTKILGVRYRQVDPSRRFPVITGWDEWHAPAGTDPAFPSGNAIILDGGEYGDPGLPVLVTYAAPFIPLVSTTDSVFSTPVVNDLFPPNNGYGTVYNIANLTMTQADIPVLGAVINLTQPQEITRNRIAAQGDPSKAADVPPQAIATSVNGLVVRRESRIDEERTRLEMMYPDQRR